MSDHGRNTVVVGVDGTKDGLVALAWAAEYAAERQSRLLVMYVVDPARYSRVPTPWVDEDGTDVLEDAAAEVARLGYELDLTVEIRSGSPTRALLAAAAGGAMLVIGRRGRDGFAELMVGSVSQACAALATTPVVVVPDVWRPETPSWQRIVVGSDGSAGCQPALDFAFELASRRAAQVCAVYAVETPLADYPIGDLWLDPEQPPPWSATAERLLAETLAGQAERYPDVPVVRRAVAGHPIQVLATETAMADLLVVGGHGRSRFTELRLGSIARGLLHHAHCPVAVIHGGRQR